MVQSVFDWLYQFAVLEIHVKKALYSHKIIICRKGIVTLLRSKNSNILTTCIGHHALLIRKKENLVGKYKQTKRRKSSPDPNSHSTTQFQVVTPTHTRPN